MNFSHLWRAPQWTGAAALYAALLLSACGGGGDGKVEAEAKAQIMSVHASQLLMSPPPVNASVVALTKVSETRVSRTVYDYVFKVTVQNGGVAQMGVTANLTAAGTGTTILDGSVAVGDMAANASVTPADTITLRQDRTYALDQAALKWSITSVASAGSVADARLSSVGYGADKDGVVYGIAGVDLSNPVKLTVDGSSPDDLFTILTPCGAPKISVIKLDTGWRLVAKGADLIANKTTDVCLRVVNLTAGKYTEFSLKVAAIAPVNTGVVAIAPMGSATYTTSGGSAITFAGNNSSSAILANVFESTSPDGRKNFVVTFNTDVRNAGLTVQLPDLNLPSIPKSAQQLRVQKQSLSGSAGSTIREPYLVSDDELGFSWRTFTAPVTEDGMRLPNGYKSTPVSVDPLLVAGSTPQLIGSKPPPQMLVSYPAEVSSLHSVLPLPAQQLSDEEVVVFINGFQLEGPALIAGYIGGGKGTWGEFPRLVGDPKLFGGKQLIPFEFRWATNARFADVADDLAQSIKTIDTQIKPKKIHLVAHSFGGLLVRTLLQGISASTVPADTRDAIALVKSVLTLGTPHSGIQEVSNSSLPNGQDKILGLSPMKQFCQQVTCYEAGAGGILTDAQLAILYGRFVPPRGWLPIGLTDTTQQLPDIDFYVGIGLRANSVLGDAGDKLISYEGQRFAPQLRTGPLLGNTSLLDLISGTKTERFLGARLRESILGSDVRPLAGVPAIIFSAPRANGYGHQGVVATGLPPFTDSDGGILGFGFEAQIQADCGVNQESACKHGSLLLLQQMLIPLAPTVSSTSPGTMVANGMLQPLTLIGTNFLSKSVVQVRTGNGSWATVQNWVTEPNPDPRNSVSPTQLTVMFNPGGTANVYGIRVCRAGYAITDADCSSEFSVTATDNAPLPPANFPTSCNGVSTVMGAWTRFGTATYDAPTNTFTVGDTVWNDPLDADGDCNVIAGWSNSPINFYNTAQDPDWLIYNQSTTGNVDFTADGCITFSPRSAHVISLASADPGFTGASHTGHTPLIADVAAFAVHWNLGQKLFYIVPGIGWSEVPNAVYTAGKGFCGVYRTTRVGNKYSVSFNGNLLATGTGAQDAVYPNVRTFDDVVTLKPTVIFGP